MPYEKVGDNEPVCIADEVPFEIPDSWEWCKLSFICSLTNGEKVNDKVMNNLDAKYLRGLKKPDQLSSGYLIKKNEIMILVDGENSGEIFISNENGYQGSTFKKLNISNYLYSEYVISFIKYYNYLLKKKKIGAAIPHLNKNIFFSLLFPMPPYKEQIRIVNTIEMYLPLINKYDKLQTELDSLNMEFPEKLKKSILQQAIKGKLVEQTPSDEPASVLLDKIRKEKEKLIKEGKIKKDKNESIIYKRDNSYYEKLNGVEKCIDDEIPFEIPESWEWCRFENLLYILSGTSYKSSDIKNSGIRILRGGNIQNYKIILNDNDVFLDNKYKHTDKTIKNRDIVFVASTGSKEVIGKPAFVQIDDGSSIQIGAFLRIARLYSPIIFNWVKIIFCSNYYKDHIKDSVKGTNINNVKNEYVTKMLIPIPSCQDQKRIGVIINKSFSIVEALFAFTN